LGEDDKVVACFFQRRKTSVGVGREREREREREVLVDGMGNGKKGGKDLPWR